MSFTSTQRATIYAKAIQELKNGKARFICPILKSIVFEDYDYAWPTDEDILTMFSEFGSQKPKETFDDLMWWPKHDLESRIKALTRCIELTQL